VGVNRPGAFAEFLVIPAVNAFPIPDDIPDEIAAILDPFGNAAHTALSFDLVGEDVLITGAGPIGIMAAAICRHVGARHVVITDVNDYRLELAKKMGAHRTVNIAREKLADIMPSLNMVEGFDVGLEMSGNPAAFRDMLAHMCHGGKIAMLGIPEKEIAIDWNTANSLTGFGLGAYSVQGSGDVPPEPLPQKLAVPSSKQPAARVPILGDPTKRVKAIYPEFAKAAGMDGEVAVEIVVDESGKVISAKALSGPAVLRQAAISAALGWKFTPTRVDGSPTQAVGTIRFRFEPLADNRNARARTNGRVSDVTSGTANGRRP